MRSPPLSHEPLWAPGTDTGFCQRCASPLPHPTLASCHSASFSSIDRSVNSTPRSLQMSSMHVKRLWKRPLARRSDSSDCTFIHLPTFTRQKSASPSSHSRSSSVTASLSSCISSSSFSHTPSMLSQSKPASPALRCTSCDCTSAGSAFGTLPNREASARSCCFMTSQLDMTSLRRAAPPRLQRRGGVCG